MRSSITFAVVLGLFTASCGDVRIETGRDVGTWHVSVGADRDAAANCADIDGDGYTVAGCGNGAHDCDDTSDRIFPGAIETCDGIDNDCDGEVDEGMSGIGAECEIAVDGCTLSGHWQCTIYGGTACLPDENPEACNGIDDDCDGIVDEDVPLAGPCETGLVGVCSLGVLTCHVGEWACEPLQSPSIELCDFQDNDCDGGVDENADDEAISRSCYDGPDATDGVGVCTRGVEYCRMGVLSACIGEVLPSDEVCDQLDNDCDGQTDEGLVECGCTPLGAIQDCYTGPEETLGVGTCHAGTQACVVNGTSSSWGPCDGEVRPSVELCTPPGTMAANEDCDRGDQNNELVDEGLMFGVHAVELGDSCALGVGGCRAQGVYTCAEDGAVYCTAEPSMPLPEVCNGIDDNCNGQIDESPAGSDCIVGVGACARNGVEICVGVELRCNVEPGVPSVEICNGIDDNCDGVVDNVLLDGAVRTVGQPCTLGLGVCADDGEWECDGEGDIRCDATPREPGPEICDGLDNNCNGEVDDGLGLGNLCVGVGVCGNGTWECNAFHQVVCSTLPGGSVSPAEVEQCNGIDDDCDGEADEAFFGLGEPCLGACGVGVVECNLTETYTQCSTYPGGSEYDPTTEICDGVDNDCDYMIDNGFSIGSGCGLGVCAGGTYVCDGPDASVCSTTGLASAELCDGLDNDCDGMVDEGFDVGFACDGVGACGLGVYECDGLGAARCSTNPGGSDDDSSSETCDGLDNDCDGQTDEGNPGGGVACDGNDADVCNEGVSSCVGGILTCSDATGDSVEVCNGQDDDCDGTTDEGFNLGGACDGIGECGAGTTECNGVGGTRCSTDVGGSQDQHVEEKLSQNNCTDGLDNDCDGLTDSADSPDCP